MFLWPVLLLYMLPAVAVNSLTTFQKWHPCYKSLCRCSGVTAVCTKHGQNLTYIPPLPSNIRQLNFTYNYLNIINQTTFFNLHREKFIKLYLIQNNISRISANAFDEFTRLKTLDLSLNHVHLPSLKMVLQSFGALNLKQIIMRAMGHGNLLYDALEFLNSSSVIRLNLQKNDFTFYNQTRLKHVENLLNIDLDGNHIAHTFVNSPPFLKTIGLRDNRLTTIPNFCQDSSNINLIYVFLNKNRIREILSAHINCLKNLQQISFDTNPITCIATNTFALLPSLQILFLRHLIGPLKYIDEYAFNNSKLFKINLYGNSVNMARINSKTFWGCENLKRLELSFNKFYYVNESVMDEMFIPLINLQRLDLGSCGLQSIPKVVTNNLTQLTHLGLFKNIIRSWPPGTFDRLRSLQKLYLTNNRISHIQENSFPSYLRQHLIEIDLAGNTFDCSCELLWFVNWFKNNRSLFKQKDNVYLCTSPKSVHNVQLINLNLSQEKCLLGEITIFTIVIVASFVLFATVLASFVYMKRWSLRHCLYTRKYKQRLQQDLEEDYLYDVYVMYCKEDLQWIITEMLPVLEDTKHLKLCIQDRDFELGKAMIDNIDHCIQQSRSFILVASNKFVEMEWCEHQLMLVQTHLQERGLDRLVAFLLEEIDHRHMTPAMYSVVKTQKYTYWPQEEEYKQRFWDNIYNELTNVE